MDVPLGGSTGLDHEGTGAIDECARYLATTKPDQRPAPLMPAMRAMFGLSSAEVCAAIRESNLIKARAA